MGLFSLTKWNDERILIWFVLINPQGPSENIGEKKKQPLTARVEFSSYANCF